MEALVATAVGTVLVDLDADDAELVDEEPPSAEEIELLLPLVVAASQVGSRIAVVVERRPPLLLSDDAGQTWREAGGGLPAGSAIAIAEGDPDLLLYASDERLFLSVDGGVFWRSLATELIGISAVAFSG